MCGWGQSVYIGTLGAKRLKVKFCGHFPNFSEILSRYQVLCVLVLWLLRYMSSRRRRRRRTTWTNENFGQKGYFKKIFSTQLSFDMCCPICMLPYPKG